ncbi:hypothetical protein [Guptibacillus sedimenti]|uniref:hypothetical protein n=1 Tax=Guptibacillus sedimenti TaxID=3025680 RepID=UPI002361F627|nr:hypothetical protein [Pseudalkalibacillus sedimenti]
MDKLRKHCSSCIYKELKKLKTNTLLVLFFKNGKVIIRFDTVKDDCIIGKTLDNLPIFIDCNHVTSFIKIPTVQRTFEFTGSVITMTVPGDATTAKIQAIGASGGGGTSTPGLGASIEGDFPVTPGETLSILVGQQGKTALSSPGLFNGGGGGGSFVWRGAGPVTPSTLLIAAGGGGGASTVEGLPGVNASLTSSGTDGNPGGTGGVNGRGGNTNAFSGGGGAGILPSPLGDGASSLGSGGQSIFNGGAGGTGFNGSDGGFGGGGGGGFAEGGGAGGFSGGGAGGTDDSIGGGGGGGSQNNGTNQVNIPGIGNGDGQVTIEFFSI